jgi:hypothetical protein
MQGASQGTILFRGKGCGLAAAGDQRQCGQGADAKRIARLR